MVWWSDVTNEKGDGWMTWSEASRVHELRGKTDKEDYEQLLGELNGQPEATTAQWFAGRHERWDEAGLEWNRSDQRIAIRMAADASTEQRGIRNGQVKGEVRRQMDVRTNRWGTTNGGDGRGRDRTVGVPD